MRMALKLALCLLVVAGLMGAVFAGDDSKDITVTGSISCGKCTLHKADVKECQDVLMVAGEGGKSTEYWLVKNDVAEAFGHACKGEKAATVTGTVKEKDGKMWLTATKVDPATKG